MVVYIEFVIIDNFIFDFLLLLLTVRNKKEKVNKKKIILSSLFGTVFAIIFPFLNLHELILFFLKIVLAFAMVAIAGEFISFKDYFKKVNKFLLLTFCFGGIIYGVGSLLEIDYSFLYGTSNAIIPFGLLICAGLALYFLFEKLFIKLFEKKLIYPFVCKCIIFNKGQKINTVGFLDSGNTLIYDNYYSICVAGTKLVKKMFLTGFLCDKPIGKMQISTASGKSFIRIYEIDRLEIYFGDCKNIINKVKLGIMENNFNLSEDYQLILSAEYAFCK